MSLVRLLDDHPCSPDEVLLHGDHRSWTAGEFRDAVDELAAAVRSTGVRAGRPVAVVGAGADMVIAMFAVWRAGGVLVPINPRLPQASIGEVLEATGTAALITEAGVEAVGAGRPLEADSAFVLWTSGTTGRPKAVLHTHRAYLELLDRVLSSLRTGIDKKRPAPNLIAVSMALNAGIYNALFGLRAGASLVVMDRFEPALFARRVEEHGIRSTVLPPAAIAALLEHPEITDLGPLRYVRSITAPLSPRLARGFVDRFGVMVLNGYGQAEIGEVIGWTAAQGREHPDKVGSVGTPHAGVELRIDAPDGRGVGELCVRPPNRAAGYADGGDLSDRLDQRGFIRTGDLARIDDAGFVWIEGRVGDLINRGGNKVFPDEVEEVIEGVDGVREAAVTGAPDERLGEVPVAYVVTDHHVDDLELEEACRSALVPYKVPVRFERLTELPRNEIGKVLRHCLEEALAAERNAAP